MVTAKIKNSDINQESEKANAIRIAVPTDQTIPDYPQNLALYAYFEQVMFVFDNVLDKDVTSYEYQLYKSDQVTGSFPNYSLVSNPIIYLSGESGSNVFSVAVENSTDITTIRYYGRVRTKDSSNNYSSWSPLALSDQDTPLIGNQYVSSITAAKITAGTIGAHQIILSQAGPQTNIAAPANMAILRSSDYNGSYNSNTSTWTNGTSGWIVAGDGHAEFSSASIRGGLKAESVYIDANNRWRRNNTDTAVSNEFKVGSSTKYLYFDGTNLSFTGDLSAAGGTFTGAISGGTIDIGGSDATSFHVDSAGNMWLGASTYAAAPFKVSSAGAFSATSGSISGSLISGGTISGTSININSGTFQVTSTGALTATSANITGTINASSGQIAGWQINSDNISYSSLNGETIIKPISDYLTPFVYGGSIYARTELYWGMIEVSSNGAFGTTVTQITPGSMVIDSITQRIDMTTGNIDATGEISASLFNGNLNAGTVNTLYMNPKDDDQIYIMSGDGFAYYGVNYGPGSPNAVGFLWDFPNLYGVVDNAASMVIGSLSDIRSKSEISTAKEDWIDKLLTKTRIVEFIPVNPFEWDEKAKNSKEKPKRLGIIAQELKDVFPHLVTGGKNPEDLLSVDYMGLIPHIIQVVQNLEKRIQEIERQ